MSAFKGDDLNERLDAAAKAKQAMLEKFRARQRAAAPAPGGTEAVAPEPVADGPGEAGEAGTEAPRKAGKPRK
jgi:Family of unknown function (DUF6481)